MTPERQRNAFDLAQRRATQQRVLSAFAGQDLATIGESLYCYVPRLLRHLEFEQLLVVSSAEIESLYGTGSWAIDDLIRLLERIADETGAEKNGVANELLPVTIGGDSFVGSQSVRSVSSKPSDEVESVASPHSPASHGDEQLSDVAGENSSKLEPASCVNDEAMQAEFDAMRQVLLAHATHPLLDEELREFLEPGDNDIPTEFLGNSVREVLEMPFVRVAQRWVSRGRVRCLLNLVFRAVTSIRSLTGCPDEDATNAEAALRPCTIPVARDINDDGRSWRIWCDIIHEHGIEWMMLGTVAECLRDVPSTLWHRPLADFTVLTFRQLAELPSVGPKKLSTVLNPIRSLAVELQGLPRGPNVRMKFFPGPLRGVQSWIERVMESREVPSVNEVAIHLLRPLAWQLQHDLTEREARIAIHRLRLGESAAMSTLEELAKVHGITRERIRQLESWGPRVLQLRFRQGRYLLEVLHRFLVASLKADEQASMVQQILGRCFESTLATTNSREEVLVAWEETGRNKLTPMTVEQIHQWSGHRLPMLAPADVCEIVTSTGRSFQTNGQTPLWFTRSECDRLLFVLYHRPGPARLGELLLLDKLSRGDESANESVDELDASDERNLLNKLRRDPRFVECDEHQLLPSERCGFERHDGRWQIRLVRLAGAVNHAIEAVAVGTLATLLVGGLLERGIADATVWGVHRYANEMLARIFGANLPESVTPFILADMLVKLSGGLIHTMKRRRLRWDATSTGLTARGKRGWVGQVVSEFGRPLVLSELNGLLRQHYQDYADYVVNQIVTAMEDGEADDRVQFVSELGHSIPTLVVPSNWTLDSVHNNVSEEILEVVRRLARQVRSRRMALDELKSVNWLMTLVGGHVSANADAADEREVHREPQPPDPSQKIGMYPINVTRIGSTRMPHRNPFPAFIRIHGQRVGRTINRQAKPILCNQCGEAIPPGDTFAVEDVEHNGLRLLLFLSDDSMRRWCLGCIDYEHVASSEETPPLDGPAPVVLKFSRGKLQVWTVAPPSDEPSPTTATAVLSTKELDELHLTADASRVLAADLEQSVENLFGYTFSRILARAPTHRPWSLAELSLVEGDVEWLKALIERATASNLRQVVSGPSRFKDYSRDAQLGAVLLLLESELARRHASEGMLWSAIHQQVGWRGDASRFLFNHRQPNARHKACLEAAAKELGLRCAFGEDSAQEWYQSVFLQCGFSKKSFEGRLPQWLAGENTPVSVTRLLSSDARYASSSFAALWTALREYRQGSLDRPGLKAVLESSPWVLREWHDSLTQRCRAESHSSTSADGQVDVLVSGDKLLASGDSGATTSDRRFLSEPRLRWSNETLQFICGVVLSDGLELEDDADIVIGGQVRSRLIMQADGSFDATPNEIELPTSSPTVVVELRSFTAVTIATQSLTLWDDGDDVAGYVVKTGRRIEPWSREFSQRETLLIYSADLRIEPARPSVAVLGNGTRHVVRLLPQETANTRLFLGTELLWEPDAPTYPAWRDRVHTDVELRPRESPTQFRVCVSHPSEVTATAVRFRRDLLDLKHDSANRSNSDWLPLDSELRIAEAIAFTVLLRMGDEKTELRRRVPWRLPGHLWRRGDRWEAIPARMTCEMRELRQAEFRLSPPESEIKGDRWQLFEGRRWIDSVRDRPQRITAVDGWGAPLVLRAAPYNCCQPEQPLLQGLTDQGEIREVEVGPDGVVTISLYRPISPDESHAVVVFDELGETTFIEKEELAEMWQDDSTSTVWKLSSLRLADDHRVVALAVAYNGERLGSWWQHDWIDVFRRPVGLADNEVANWASNVADALRWFRLPILSRDNAPQVREFAKAFAVPVLSAWLSQHRSRRLIHDAIGEGWLCVVRAIFADWLPSTNEAQELDTVLESALSDGTKLPLKTTMLALADVGSLLAARFIRTRLQSDGFKSAKVNQTRALIAAIKLQILGSDSVDSLVSRVAQDVARTDEPPEGTLDFVRDSLLAKSLLVLDRPESSDVSELDRSNVEVAMRLDAFRSLVLVACLERISKELL